MKIIVTFATGWEFKPWRALRPFRRMASEEIPLYETRIAEAQVRVALTGVGLRQAAHALRLVLKDSTDACIASGLAGGLRTAHRSGEILVARGVRHADRQRCIGSDENFLRLAGACGAKVVEAFWTSESILMRAEDKFRLGGFADAVDMESFPILAEAWACGLSAVAIRVIGDPLEQDLPLVFNRVLDERGKPSTLRLLTHSVKVPHCLPSLMRLAVQDRRAVRRLARFLDQYVEVLASHKTSRERSQ